MVKTRIMIFLLRIRPLSHWGGSRGGGIAPLKIAALYPGLWSRSRGVGVGGNFGYLESANNAPTKFRLELKKKFQQEFYKALKEVEKYDRSSKLTVEEAILVYPEIVSDVARIVTAMPPTQVSVERLFSALKIIKPDLRASMKEDLPEAILFLRTLH